MSTRVFLTGLSGYFGQTLAEHLGRAPEVECVTGISRSTPRWDVPPKVRFIKMDVRSPDVAEVMAGHDAVIHTAAIVLWFARMSAAERDDINFNGTRNVARAAAAAGISTFVQASSVAVYYQEPKGRGVLTEEMVINDGHTSSYYADAKAGCERILASVLGPAGVRLVFLRPTYVVGPRSRTTVDGFRAGAVRFTGSNPRLQFIHEDDVAEAFTLALRGNLQGPYNVVPDDSIPLSDVIQVLGVRFAPVVPFWLARAVSLLRWRYLGSATHPSWVDLVRLDAVGSNARRRAAGWQPSYISAEALRSAL